MNKSDLESLYGMNYYQSLIDEDLKQYGYITAITLKYLGNSDIVIDKEFKARAAK